MAATVRRHPSPGSKGGAVGEDKLMRHALIRALHREARNANGQPTRKLEAVADKLVDLAISGDMQAIHEIFERVDGRLPQPISAPDGGPVKLVIGWLTGEQSQLEPPNNGTVIDAEPAAPVVAPKPSDSATS
jgi:hypothetical protein